MVSQAMEEPTVSPLPNLSRKLTIGQLTDAVTRSTGIHCTPAMIYNYERKGLLDVCERTEGGFRLFELEAVQRVAAIKRWQADGLTLEEIGHLLENGTAEFDEGALELDLPDDRRTQILKAATQVFPQKGYEATTLLDIAERADISSAAIYQYFQSKEVLFLAITDHFSFRSLFEQISGMLRGKEFGSGEDVYRALVEVSKTLLVAHAQNREIHRMFLTESRAFPQIGKAYCRRLITPMQEMLAELLFDPVEEGVFRNVNPRLAAHAFYGLLFSFQVIHIMLQGDDMLALAEEGGVEQLVDIYLDGILQ